MLPSAKDELHNILIWTIPIDAPTNPQLGRSETSVWLHLLPQLHAHSFECVISSSRDALSADFKWQRIQFSEAGLSSFLNPYISPYIYTYYEPGCTNSQQSNAEFDILSMPEGLFLQKKGTVPMQLWQFGFLGVV